MNKEILIIRLSSIGDIIHCTPVAGALKAAWPDCRITWLIGENCADLIKYSAAVDEVMVWSRERFDKHLRAREFRQAFSLWRQLQTDLAAKEFYAALDIHGLFLTGLIIRQVKTERRIGMSGARELNPLFMTGTAGPLGPHITERYLGVATALGIDPSYREMSLTIPPSSRQFAEQYITAAGIAAGEKIAILVPGTTWPTKNWPPEFFAETARLLAGDFRILLCGGKGELPLGRVIEANAGVRVLNAIGQTTLLEMAGLLEKATVVVAGDTGPIYMAAALGTPTVTVFGPTNPAVYKPPGNKHASVASQSDCAFCHKTKCPAGTGFCMRDITPAAVVRQVYSVVTD